MSKKFCVTGTCVPEKNYMVDISERIEKITKDYIEHGQYFTINRARQYGKTTTLYLLEQRLQKEYLVLSLSFEAADEYFQSLENLAEGLVMDIGECLKNQNVSDEILTTWESPLSEKFPMRSLGMKITNLCRACSKKIVLMIDEVDKSSDNQIFLSFLGLLREKYLRWQQGKDETFQSVILAGVYDVKNLKLKLHPQEETKYNSPWNIAVDFRMDMSFHPKDIGQMLEKYESEHKTNMDISEIAEQIYNYTSGYPYLVSKVCKLIDEQCDKNWTRQGVSDAVKMLLKEANPLFDDLRKKITDYPELRKMLYAILFRGESYPYNPDNFAMDIGTMFGFIKEKDGQAVIANRIFETRLYNLFLSEELTNSAIYQSGERDKNQFIKNNVLNMELVLEKFMIHFHDIYGENTDAFVEENGRRLFLLYLKPIINGTGNYYIEAQTRDQTRTDIIVDYLGKQYVVELKIWHGNEYNKRGEKQLAEYLEYYHLEKGYLLSFNFNKNKKTGMKEIQVGEKKLVEVVV